MKSRQFFSAVVLLAILIGAMLQNRPFAHVDAVINVASVGTINNQALKAGEINDYSTAQRLWALSSIEAQRAWKITAGNPQILIGVVDTGIDEEHPDLQGQVVDRVNFSTSSTVEDVFGHGTHVAGIIAARNDGLITGLAYNCRLLNVKVADDGGWLDKLALARGIRWAADRGARVICISLYNLENCPEVEEAVTYAWGKGAIIVAASGNGVGKHDVYPAHYARSLGVAATDTEDKITKWSGRGEGISTAAPGENIFSTMPNSSYEFKSGTSMATAYVAGLAALLFSEKPDGVAGEMLNDTVRSTIQSSCDPLDAGIGRINVFKAVCMFSSGVGPLKRSP